MTALWGWQRSACNGAWQHLANGRRTLLVAPTGGGKTVMGSSIAHQVLRRGGRVLWLAHRRELVRQAAATLEGLGHEPGIIMAGEPMESTRQLQVASIPTLQRRSLAAWLCWRSTGQPNLTVVDEAHHAIAETWQEVLGRVPGWRLGLTATPFRLDGRGLGPLFDALEVGATTRQLINLGNLLEPRVFAPDVPDLEGVRKVGGDYVASVLAEIMESDTLVGSIVEHWQRLAAGRRTVVFCVNVSHAQLVAQKFICAGVRAAVLHGGTPTSERDALLQRLASHDLDVLCNCMVLTEGWDLPHLAAAVIARPTASLCLHLQMLGRCMRAAEGKEAPVVLDHAGNHLRHGPAGTEYEYTLDDDHPVGGRASALKTCPECFAMLPNAKTRCPECGHIWEKQDNPDPEESDGQLREIPSMDTWAMRVQLWADLAAESELRGFADGWAQHRFKEATGEWPLVHEGALVDPARATPAIRREYFKRMLASARVRGWKEGWASWRYRDTFGRWPKGFVAEVRQELANGE